MCTSSTASSGSLMDGCSRRVHSFCRPCVIVFILEFGWSSAMGVSGVGAVAFNLFFFFCDGVYISAHFGSFLEKSIGRPSRQRHSQ